MTHPAGKVLLERDGHVAVLTLNDPATLNALAEEMLVELLDAIHRLRAASDKPRCLLITGAGRGFCSGGSVTMIDEGGKDGPITHITLGTHLHYMMKVLKDLPYPVVTAVNGPAAGFGFSFALAGDMVVAARSAFFLSAFRRLGVSPDGGLSWMLPRIIGWARAKELMVMGTRLPADKALDWGLVNRVYDDETFRAESLALAHELAAGPTLAIGITRRLFWEGWSRSYEEQIDQEERVQAQTFASNDAAEGVRAMLEKREARFEGR